MASKCNFVCVDVSATDGFPDLRTAKFNPVCAGLPDEAKLTEFFKDTPPGSISVSWVPIGKYEVGQTYSVDITIE